MPEATHQLAAIMFTDIVGYTAIMGKDEHKALALLKKNKEIHERFLCKCYLPCSLLNHPNNNGA